MNLLQLYDIQKSRLLSAVLVLIAVCLASISAGQTGHWTVTYNWSANAAFTQVDSTDISCYGPLTATVSATFTWTGALGGQYSPSATQTVLLPILEQSSAKAIGRGQETASDSEQTSVTGLVSMPQGFTSVTSSGYNSLSYHLKPNVLTFTLPVVTLSVTGPTVVWSNSMFYSVGLGGPQINLVGPLIVSGDPTIVVGQKVQASISTSATGDTFKWSFGDGNPFANYVASKASATFSGASQIAKNSPSPTFYFQTPLVIAAVKCSYVPISGTLAGKTINVQANVNVDGPVYQAYNSLCVANAFGSMQATNQIPGVANLQLWGATLTTFGESRFGVPRPSTWGTYDTCALLDPASGIGAGGSWGYVQLKTLDKKDGSDVADLGIDFGKDGSGWPQPTYVDDQGAIATDFRPTGVYNPQLYSDAPRQSSAEGSSWDSSFSSYIFYKPPDDALGAGTSVYVPLRKWTWKAGGTISYVNGSWDVTDHSSAGPPSLVFSGTTFPTWPIPTGSDGN